MSTGGTGGNSGNAGVGTSVGRSATFGGGGKRALLIGVNYMGTDNELSGPGFDAMNMQHYLKSIGFLNFKILGDSPDLISAVGGSAEEMYPSKQNVINAFSWLVSGLSSGDQLFLLYSGHGGRYQDQEGRKTDGGYDCCIFPVDFQTVGQLTDIDLHKELVNKLPSGVSMTCVFDCCHSGTILDLPFQGEYTSGKFESKTVPQEIQSGVGRVACFSSCLPTQTSADVTMNGQHSGALTKAWLEAAKQNSDTFEQMMQYLDSQLDKARSSIRSTPVLSMSLKPDWNSPYTI